VSGEISGDNDTALTLQRVDAIGSRLDAIFATAKAENVITNEVADRMARAKIAAGKTVKAPVPAVA
jgi:leucine dehydrogenase